MHELEYWAKISDVCLVIFIDVIEVEVQCTDVTVNTEVVFCLAFDTHTLFGYCKVLDKITCIVNTYRKDG